MLGVILTACVTPLPIVNFVADARSPNAKITTKASRFFVITFRTFRAGTTQEIAEAECILSTLNNSISAKFRTPAHVQVPIYNGKPQDIDGQCRTKGGETETTALFKVSAKKTSMPNMQNTEGVTISVGTSRTTVSALFSLRDRPKDQVNYPSQFSIMLQP